MVSRLRVLTWNLNCRLDVAGQVTRLAAASPDIVALQEVRPRSWEAMRRCLSDAGFGFAVCSRPLAGTRPVPRSIVAIASRWALGPFDPPGIPRLESAVAATVAVPSGPIDVITVHMPLSRRGREVPRETQRALHGAASSAARPLILLGDFNSPRAENADGSLVTFETARPGRAAEALVMFGTTSPHLVDAYRALHGYEAADVSWRWAKDPAVAFRIDHIFASPALRPRACVYLHEFRESRASDHSAMVADFEFT